MSESASRPLGVREGDPAGAKFYMHPVKPPEGDWSYIVDDFGIAYRLGYWPFRSANEAEDRESVAAHKRQGLKHGEDWTPGEGCGWRPVRLSPDSEYCAAGQNYVMLWPDMREDWKANADLHLYVRPQGLGAITLECSLVIDLRDMTGTVTTWPIGGSPIGPDGFSEDFPGALKGQAGEKRDKILAFLAEHMAARQDGKRKIETAHDRWARKSAS
jgi:hypothetical protein